MLILALEFCHLFWCHHDLWALFVELLVLSLLPGIGGCLGYASLMFLLPFLMVVVLSISFIAVMSLILGRRHVLMSSFWCPNF